jgi:hypothetical protein
MNNPENTHVYLVSAQATPNITPALDALMQPQRIILLVSADMQQRADWLESVLRPRGIKLERWSIEDPWDIESVQMEVLELLEKEQQQVVSKKIALNATGGTKPMSIAAYETFRVYDLPIFYVHPERDHLTWLHPTKRPAQELTKRISLESFLQAYGASIDGQPQRNIPQKQCLEVAHTVVENLCRYQKPLGALNRLASQARRSLVSPRIEREQETLMELIDVFARYGFLKCENKKLRFPSELDRFFVNGGWIEAWVFDQLRKLRKTDKSIQDCAYNINIKRTRHGNAVPNELDVAFLRNNRLHIIECKTANFTGGGGKDATGALYKLDSLRDLMGGLQARAMLISYRDLPGFDLNRAKDLGVHVCAGKQLLNLSHHFYPFIG